MDPVNVTDLECVHDAVKHKEIRTGLVGTADGLATLVYDAPRDVIKGADLAPLSKTLRREILEGVPELSAKPYRQLKREITLANRKAQQPQPQPQEEDEAADEITVTGTAAAAQDS